MTLGILQPWFFTPGLEDRFPYLLPTQAFYLAEVLTLAFSPADLVALKEMVETDGGVTLRLKRAWVPFSRWPSGALPLEIFEGLVATGALQRDPKPASGSASLKREALDSVDAVHRQSPFRPKREKTEEKQSSSLETSVVSGEGGVSYLSFNFVPEVGECVCRRHFSDGSREDYGMTALVMTKAAPDN